MRLLPSNSGALKTADEPEFTVICSFTHEIQWFVITGINFVINWFKTVCVTFKELGINSIWGQILPGSSVKFMEQLIIVNFSYMVVLMRTGTLNVLGSKAKK